MPADARAAKQAALADAIDDALRDVASLDEDRIIRRFVNAVQAAVRTTFYQLDEAGRPKPFIAIKLDSRRVEGMALPRPLFEVFLYSPRMEAVHLRFGKVARGGIRWSDRPQDFRTEILGLVKAQQVKNAVIVPVGAKGEFVPKALPACDRERSRRRASPAIARSSQRSSTSPTTWHRPASLVRRRSCGTHGGRRDTTHCAQRSAAKEIKTTYHKLCGKRYLLLVYSVLPYACFALLM